ncbi:conserved protein of unknown function [Limnospira indica PCC 8005]|uniref:Uncharacterized protein n=1 Tax=Limnospira indica PCC 8005 TaxID=376219 RepID=A0A9P1KKB5_9CYAN|nr:conserved protein of unknown function [Limnospira indica PCC 8005]
MVNGFPRSAFGGLDNSGFILWAIVKKINIKAVHINKPSGSIFIDMVAVRVPGTR